MNRNVRCTNFFFAVTYRPQLDTPPPLPPLEIIITVCHEKSRHPLTVTYFLNDPNYLTLKFFEINVEIKRTPPCDPTLWSSRENLHARFFG